MCLRVCTLPLVENISITPRREVRAWMVRTGRTWRALSAELGVSHSYLANVLAGRKRCSLDLAVRWANLSDLPVPIFNQLRPAKAKRKKAS